jgi:TrmH family RNA methyltransferase
MRTETLTSAANPLLKSIRRAIARGRLTDDGYCVAEGFHLLEEALRSECHIKTVLVAESVREPVISHVRGLNHLRVITMSGELLSEVASTENPQGVIALVQPPAWTLNQVLRANTLAMVLDGIQEPGNAGAIIRSTEAFGGTGVVLLKGSVNPFNPKSVRASAGSIFRLPCVYGIEESVLCAALDEHNVALFAAVPGAGLDIANADFKHNCAVIIGSEGVGISPDLERAAEPVRIPISAVESLNAAVAAGIVLYEARRQRMRLQ